MTKNRAKQFEFEGNPFEIDPTDKIKFENDFYSELYQKLFERLIDGNCAPHIDCDTLTSDNCGIDFYELGIANGLKLNKPSNKSANIVREKTQIAMQAFCSEYPLFVSFLQNCRFKAAIAIQHAECLTGEHCSISNFIKLKRITGDFNRLNWIRQMDGSVCKFFL